MMEENNQVAIDIDAEVMEILPEEEKGNKRAGDNLQKLIQEKLEIMPENPTEERTIFRLPYWYHEAHNDLFDPKVVSIGPYHHGKMSLRSMEEKKWFLLRDFLAKKQNVGIEVYIQAMRALELRARKCYGKSIDMDSDHFVMMLLLDGCYLLWFFLEMLSATIPTNIVGWQLADLLTDIILLENQLPFFVIHKLFSIQRNQIGDCKGSCELLDILFKHPLGCNFISISALGKRPKVSCSDIYHILHLVHTCMVDDHNDERRYGPSERSLSPPSPHPKLILVLRNASRKQDDSHDQNTENEVRKFVFSPASIPCATILNDAGVKFKKKRDPRNRFDITFINGTLAIPFLSINSSRKILYSNVAAFEQSQIGKDISTTFTEYLTLMDALVNTEKDVILLQRSEILENMLPNEQDAAAFFNDIGKLFVVEKYAGNKILDELRKYSNSSWNKQRARLVQDYFNSPWSAISVVAAGVLLVLTFLQTFYTMK